MPSTLEPQTPAKPPRFALPRLKQKPPRPRPDQCLNCGRAVDGNFCAFCGQENKDHTVALRPLLSDLLAEVASWDSKMLRTLVPLVIRPGFLTNEYNAGRRIGYLSPLKLYLTVSVLFFLALSWKAPLNKHNVAINTSGVSFGPAGGKFAAPAARTAAEYDASQKLKPPARRDPPLLRTLIHHLFKAKQSPMAFISAIIGGFPKMMFFLLPLFAVSLKLLYLRRKRLYVEHLVFLLHVHAFAFLVLTPLLLLPLVWRGLFVCLALPVYFIAALRAVYKQGWPKTLTKFVLLGLGYFVLLALCFAGTTLVALMLL
jgi:hypothetical protein